MTDQAWPTSVGEVEGGSVPLCHMFGHIRGRGAARKVARQGYRSFLDVALKTLPISASLDKPRCDREMAPKALPVSLWEWEGVGEPRHDSRVIIGGGDPSVMAG